MLKIDKEVFERNLLLTQTYCEMQLANTDKPVAEVLRSFNPEYNGEKIFLYKNNPLISVEWSIDPLDKENEYLYNDLFENHLLHKIDHVKDYVVTHKPQGSILIVEVDTTELDGGATAYSKGLFDLYDWPPIDTWFYATKLKNKNVLLAWVPAEFIELVDEGICVSLTDKVYWLEDWEIKNDRFIQETSRYAQPHKNFIQRNPFIIKLAFALCVSLTYVLCMSSC